MTRALVVVAGLICVASAPALALDKPNALGRAEGIYTPRTGDWEFSLTAPAYPVIAGPPRGVGVTINTGTGGSTDTALGLGIALGYCITDLVEVGGAFAFDYAATGGVNGQGGGNTTNLSIEPFVKANFGSGMARDSRINPFALGAVSLGYVNRGVSSALITFELAGGAEFMLTHTWGLTVDVPFVFYIPTASNSSASIGIGLGYGIVAYFN
jgi:hypothetical protein